MAKIKKGASTLKQMAYARRLLGAQGTNKKQIALDVGYSPSVANSIVEHIESKPGFHNAMAKLAEDSNNLALAAMSEFKSRGLKDFSNKDLVSALNAIAQAWSRFNAVTLESKRLKREAPNRLRTIVMSQVNVREVIPEEEGVISEEITP